MHELHLLAFVLWVIGWPCACVWRVDFERNRGFEYPRNVRFVAALIEFALWIFVAVVLLKH